MTNKKISKIKKIPKTHRKNLKQFMSIRKTLEKKFFGQKELDKKNVVWPSKRKSMENLLTEKNSTRILKQKNIFSQIIKKLFFAQKFYMSINFISRLFSFYHIFLDLT